MNKKIRDSLFACMVITLLFTNIPKFMQINFLFGSFSRRLTVFFVCIGLLYTLYLAIKTRLYPHYWNVFKRFSIIYLVYVFISLVYGLYQYPYYDVIINGPVSQIDKFPSVMNWLSSHNIQMDQSSVVGIWIVIRFIKNAFLEYLYTFGTSYMLFNWYYEDWEKGINVLLQSIFVSVLLILGYNFIELAYLSNIPWGTKILSAVNPYIHEVQNEGTWYPPLLWNKQLRSLFVEPSYYGIYAAIALPFLWYMFINKLQKSYVMLSIIGLFTCGIFLTKARTANVLFFSELILLSIYLLYAKHKTYIYKGGAILFVTLIGFIGSVGFINYAMLEKTTDKISIEEMTMLYIDNNVTSVASKSGRSNKSRFAIMKASFNIGKEYPLLGVGKGLKNAYITDYLADDDKKIPEVSNWIVAQKDKGVLKSGYPSLGEYVTRFAEQGVVGVFLFVIPAGVLLFCLFTRAKYNTHNLIYITVFISTMGLLISAIGDNIDITYGYWILLGLGFAICKGSENDEKQDV